MSSRSRMYAFAALTLLAGPAAGQTIASVDRSIRFTALEVAAKLDRGTRLERAAAARRDLRRYLIENGGRLTRDSSAASEGRLFGSVLGFRGSFTATETERIVEGGELFMMVVLGPTVSGLVQKIERKTAAGTAMGKCVAEFRERLNPYVSHAVPGRLADGLPGRIRDFQAHLSTLEAEMAKPEVPAEQKEAFQELVAWGRGSITRIVRVEAQPYTWYKAGRLTTDVATGVEFFDFAGHLNDYYRRCRSEDVDGAYVDRLVEQNLTVSTEELPIY